jgi:hypothetical protein
MSSHGPVPGELVNEVGVLHRDQENRIPTCEYCVGIASFISSNWRGEPLHDYETVDLRKT